MDPPAPDRPEPTEAPATPRPAGLPSVPAINASLAGCDALAGLKQIARWLDAVASDAGQPPGQALETVELLQRLARHRQLHLAPQYLDAKRLRQLGDSPLWLASADCWRAIGDAYGRCLLRYQAGAEPRFREQLPLAIGRWLNALALQLKWTLLRYARVEARIWHDLGQGYRLAEQSGVATQRCAIEPGWRLSTPRQGLLKALMLAVAAPDALTPLQLHIAERISAHLSDRFELSASARPDCLFGFDLAASQAPARLRGEACGGLPRYFGPGSAAIALEQLDAQLQQTGAVPAELALGGCTPADVIATIAHLARHWSEHRTERRSQRLPASAQLTVVPGLVGVARWLQRRSPVPVAQQERWDAFDASDNGFGAQLPGPPVDWLAVGTLVGLRAESTRQPRVGVLRRIAADAGERQRVGIELAGDCAIPVAIYPDSPRLVPQSAPSGQAAILLNRRPDARGSVELLLHPNGLTRARELQMQVGERIYQVEPLQLIEQGRDYERISCRVSASG